jgi:hypothetical protein
MLHPHFQIFDDDSKTNFYLPSLPVTVACGYRFSEGEDQSTEEDQSFEKLIKSKTMVFALKHHA